MSIRWVVCLAPLMLARCSCDEVLSRVEPPPASPVPDAQPGFLIDSGVRGEADAAAPSEDAEPAALDAGFLDAFAPDALEPDSGAPISDLCAQLPHQTASRTFTFPDPGPCPRGQGDNSPLA